MKSKQGDKTRQDLVHYRKERARDTFSEASDLAQSQRWNGCVNRLYYACFYAVSAYLLAIGKTSKTHSGTKSSFHATMVKTGLLSDSLGDLYNQLFDNRFEGDYEDFVQFDSETVLPLLPQAQDFITTLSDITEKTLLQLPSETI